MMQATASQPLCKPETARMLRSVLSAAPIILSRSDESPPSDLYPNPEDRCDDGFENEHLVLTVLCEEEPPGTTAGVT
jgi:hypothetical protein